MNKFNDEWLILLNRTEKVGLLFAPFSSLSFTLPASLPLSLILQVLFLGLFNKALKCFEILF